MRNGLMIKKKIINNWLLIVGMFIIFCMFFKMMPIFTIDSFWYYSYLDFFNGKIPFSEWSTVRGFTLPAILWLVSKIAPHNIWGLNLALAIFYTILGAYICGIFKIVIQRYTIRKYILYLAYAMVFLFILLNPIVWGYYHAILTEPFSALFTVIAFFYALKFYYYRIDNDKYKKQGIFYIIFISVLTILLWFLKQNYFIIGLIICVGFEVASLLKNLKKTHIVYSILLIATVCLSLIVSIRMFNAIALDTGDDAIVSNILTNLRYFEKSNINQDLMSKIVILDDDEDIIGEFYFEYKPGIMNQMKYLMECLKHNPGRVLQGYWDNYFLLCGIYERPHEGDKVRYMQGPVYRDNILNTILGRSKNWNIASENRNLITNVMITGCGFATTSEVAKSLLMDSSGKKIYSEEADAYDHIHEPNGFTKLMTNKFINNAAHLGYAVLSVSVLPLLIVNLILYLVLKKRNTKYEGCLITNIIILLLSFLFMCMLTVCSYIIDRYNFPIYIALLVMAINSIVAIVTAGCDWIEYKKQCVTLTS